MPRAVRAWRKRSPVIALVSDQNAADGRGVEHQGCALVVAHLTFGEHHDKWAPLPVRDGVQLEVQVARGASDTAGNSPSLSRLAAVRWALRGGASIISRSGRPSRSASPAKMRLKTPTRLQRMQRL
jgi:hypothetical protein